MQIIIKSPFFIKFISMQIGFLLTPYIPLSSGVKFDNNETNV